MNCEIRTGSIIGGTAQSDIAICIQYHIGPGCHHQQIHSDIKLASSKQQRRCDISDIEHERERVTILSVRGCGVLYTVVLYEVLVWWLFYKASDQPLVCPEPAADHVLEISPSPVVGQISIGQ